MRFLTVLLLFVFVSSSAHSADRYDFVGLKKNVEDYNDSKDSLELKSGREYTLDKGVVVEVLNVKNSAIKQNIFDLENGLLIHDTGLSEISTECLEMITPFKDLRAERVEEITEIGCLIYDRKNRLTSRHDELDSFNKKFCQVAD